MTSEEHVSTGCNTIDELLDGGFERGTVTQVYGPPAAGKTNIAMAAAVSAAAGGGQSVVIDTEGLSMARFEQLMEGYPEENTVLSDRVVTQEVYDFAGQKNAVQEVESLAQNADVLVLDSATGFYRLERVEGGDDTGEALRDIARQVTKLLSLARKHGLAVIITNQVYSGMEDNRVQGLGGHTLEHWTGTVLRVEENDNDVRELIVEKHRAQQTGGSALFKITDTGLDGVEETTPTVGHS